MNRARLEAVRNAVGALQPLGDKAEGSGTVREMHETKMLLENGSIPPIDTLNMDTYHRSVTRGDWCQTMGCIAGKTINLYPEQAREIATNPEDEFAGGLGPADIAARILELTAEEADNLFFPAHGELHDDGRRKTPITPAQATAAIDRLLSGTAADEVWDHVPENQPEAVG